MVENTLPEGQSVLLIIGMHRSGLSLFANQCESLENEVQHHSQRTIFMS